jgi:thioredoxin 1
MITIERYTAPWCAPCRMVAPIMEEIKNSYAENNTVTFVTIDVDENPERAAGASVRSIPVVIVYRNGVEVERFAGVQSKATYINAIENQLKFQ